MNSSVMKKRIAPFFMAALFILPLIPGKLNAQGLSFSISLDKKSYAKGEPVKCTMTLKNNGKQNIVVNNRFLVNLPNGPHEVSMVITDPTNHQLSFNSRVRASFESDVFTVLQPGKITTRIYDLTGDYLFSDTGNYNILAYYENKSNAPANSKIGNPWKGTLISNKSFFSLH
jgi:hypothetical protein